MKTYDLEWRGQRLAVDAIVDENRVQIFSVREVLPHGYEQVSGDPKSAKACNVARGGQTHHDGDTPKLEGEHATALSSWSEDDRRSLMQLVRAASDLTDGFISDMAVGL